MDVRATPDTNADGPAVLSGASLPRTIEFHTDATLRNGARRCYPLQWFLSQNLGTTRRYATVSTMSTTIGTIHVVD